MKMAAIRISALLFLLMPFTPAIAEFWAPVRQQFYHDTTYLTGGIGASEQEYLESKEVRQQYNLEILTASKKGSFISMARARVATAGGTVVLDVVMDGPVLLARLPQVKYRVDVIVNGVGQVRDVSLTDKGLQRVVTHWDVVAERLDKPEVSPSWVRPVVPKTIDGIEVETVPGAEGESADNGLWYRESHNERDQRLEDIRRMREEAARLEREARELERGLR
ncbi:hypothetical protein JV46_23800 [Solemya velum gill symbiont]|uniref:Uncharacterized protein n=2 Tax=Solemya velum gill symbiont TaxID=2340 RepID=A0A0B0HFF5_SOVGS|nr:hypothetical protein [Solemya velum gill symbiont]KHF26674.1 hypothetical protein JV46_23800 [Solemya velum gill symbiont]